MHYKILADKTRFFKENEKGRKRSRVTFCADRNGVEKAAMCKVVEDLCNDAKIEEKRETAKRCLQLGKLSVEEIALCSGLSIEEVKALKEMQLA